MEETKEKELKDEELEQANKQLNEEELSNVSGGCGGSEMPNDYVIGNAPKFAIGDPVAMGDWDQATLKEGNIISVDPKPTKYKSGDRGKTYIYRCDMWDDEGWVYHNLKVPEYKLRRR